MVPPMRLSSRRAAWFFVVIAAAACGGAPERIDTAQNTSVGRRRDLPDECVQQPGKPPPKPLERKYTGVAAKARCQREVYTIMGGVTHFLGVKCAYCHEEPDYRKMTHRKSIANWMARELIPAIQKKRGGEVWCNDCHVVDGEGTAKILKNPRDPHWASEWMLTHLVEDFQQKGGNALRCKSCHGGNPGTPQFQIKIILTDRLPGKAGSGAEIQEAPEPEALPDAGAAADAAAD
jgi:hypothetical protein